MCLFFLSLFLYNISQISGNVLAAAVMAEAAKQQQDPKLGGRSFLSYQWICKLRRMGQNLTVLLPFGPNAKHSHRSKQESEATKVSGFRGKGLKRGTPRKVECNGGDQEEQMALELLSCPCRHLSSVSRWTIKENTPQIPDWPLGPHTQEKS